MAAASVIPVLYPYLHARLFARLRYAAAHRPAVRRTLMGGLILAMLCMQLLGLAHRIVHAGWPPSAADGTRVALNAALFDYKQDDVEAYAADDAATPAIGASAYGADTSAPGAGQHDHSCTEYDAATAAAGVHMHLFVPALLPGIRVLALWQAFASWDAPFVRHFSSRAPPL